MGRAWIAVAALAALILPLHAKDNISLTLALPKTLENASDATDALRHIDRDKPFCPVLLKNVSDRPWGFGYDDCSLGYDNLSFHLDLDDGRSIAIKVKPVRIWQKNRARFWRVQPGETLVLYANLYDGHWAWDEESVRGHRGFLVPIYAVTKAPDHFWTGRVEGKGVPVVFP
jgi:hypothetical protein